MSPRLSWSILQAMIAFRQLRFGRLFTCCRLRTTLPFGRRPLPNRWSPLLRTHASTASINAIVHQVEPYEVEEVWKGRTHSSSEFVVHAQAGPESPTVEAAVTAILNQSSTDSLSTDLFPQYKTLSAQELLKLGSVWLLSRNITEHPSFVNAKPTRLTTEAARYPLEEGDYLRIHHTPRRFPEVYKYNWTAFHPSVVGNQPQEREDDKPGVIVAKREGFWIVDKPGLISIHPTVDNSYENVANMIRLEKGGYTATPHRLDQNTSGLCVIATTKSFAAYFTKLLAKKTTTSLRDSTDSNVGDSTSAEKSSDRTGGVYKRYRCLVCIRPPAASTDAAEWTVTEAMQQLQRYQNETMRHYLEPSIRAPKTFKRVPGNESWLESLTNVTRVGELYPLVGSDEGQSLATSLWTKLKNMPRNCVGVVELELELLTGRTHQIRGQLAAEGFPLVGDAIYGGAMPASLEEDGRESLERLALQCCQLNFVDPDVVVTEYGEENLYPSERWNSFHLEDSWWTPYLNEYKANVESSSTAVGTTSMEDLEKAAKMKISQPKDKKRKLDDPTLLPPRVSISPGANKYVLVKATKRDQELWFVKSASARECGGPYHANVAEDLVEWLEAMDYDVTVTGGGRIDYDVDAKRARVFGFSYGFGLGDHIKAASLITKHVPGVVATYDLSRNKY